MASMIEVLTSFGPIQKATERVAEYQGQYTNVPLGAPELRLALEQAQAVLETAAKECADLLATEWWKPGTH